MKRLPLNTFDNTKRTYFRLLREFARKESPSSAEIARFRALVYGFTTALQYWGFERDGELLERLEAIEKLVEGRKS